MKEKRNDLYTVKAYAEKMGITPQGVYAQIKRGELKIVSINGTDLIKWS